MTEQLPMPTRGPAYVLCEPGDEWWFGDGNEVSVRNDNGRAVAVFRGNTPEQLANFDLIAAAFNAAEECRKMDGMDFDPIAVVQALPQFVEACINFAHGRKESRECEVEMLAALSAAHTRSQP